VRRLGLLILYFVLFASIGIALLTLVLTFAMSAW